MAVERISINIQKATPLEQLDESRNETRNSLLKKLEELEGIKFSIHMAIRLANYKGKDTIANFKN